MSWSCVEPSDDEVLAEFGALFVRLHRDTIRAELDHAVEHRTERTSEGTALLHRQLVQGAVADVALASSDSAGLLDLPKTRHRLWRGHLSLLADPWLDKLYRDAQAFEFMEKRKHPPVGGFPECPQGKR